MPVILARSTQNIPAHESWVAVAGASTAGLDPAHRVEGLPQALEAAFEAAAPTWIELGRTQRGAFSHTVSAAPNASDFGEMLAWSRLVALWGRQKDRILVICADPWLFRHLAGLEGVSTVTMAPPLALRRLRLKVRGALARIRTALRFACSALVSRKRPVGPSILLVYGHPRSLADGTDAYFGELMKELPGLHRVLHVDAPPSEARRLDAASLHAWGNPLAALFLAFTRWTPAPAGDNAWLLRRAVALEGGTAQAAAMAWQRHCQQRFLAETRPRVMAWPWENHAWERHLCADLGCLGIASVGYQHALVGRHELNYAPSPDLPDRILCSGRASRDQLLLFGHLPERMEVAGAFRFGTIGQARFDPGGPLLLVLPFERKVAAEMLDEAARSGRAVLVREHPMAPFALSLPAGLATAPAGTLAEGPALAGVVYAASSMGLEAQAAGLPALRFLATTRLAIDPNPSELTTPCAAAPGSWAQVHFASAPSPPLAAFDPPDLDRFRQSLACEP